MTREPADLKALAGRLRAAVAEQRYAEAEKILEDYGRALERVVRALPPGSPEVTALAAEWRELTESVRRRVLAGRAQTAARLERLLRSRVYGKAPARRGSWEILG